jgi:hypothetical protein
MERTPVDLSPIAEHSQPAGSVQDAIHFTYDDHQAGTAMREAPGQPNRIRAIRTAGAKYAVYFDPRGKRDSEYELYDLERDPNEADNLIGVRSGAPHTPAAGKLHAELRGRLDEATRDCRTSLISAEPSGSVRDQSRPGR